MRLDLTHIRKDIFDTFCKKPIDNIKGGSISFSHFIEQKNHVASLKFCQKCFKAATNLRVKENK